MERILKMANQKVTPGKRILEINPEHPIARSLVEMFEADAENPKLKDWYGLLVDQALLAEGSEIKDPAAYVAKVNGFLSEVLSLGKGK
jgi:molecular chaperone HtpG